MLNAYKALLALRRAHPVFAYGAFAQQYASRRDLFCYTRTGEGERYAVLLNLMPGAAPRPRLPAGAACAYNSYGGPAKELRPYEAEIWRLEGPER